MTTIRTRAARGSRREVSSSIDASSEPDLLRRNDFRPLILTIALMPSDKESFSTSLERYAPRVSNLPPPPPSPAPSPWPAPSVVRPSRSLAIAPIAIALVALGFAIGSWFRPIPDNKPPPAASPPVFTEQQAAEAKAKVCATYEKVHRAVLAAR